MATIRVYLNNKRMATGKEWKGKFLQVYPTVKEFPNQTEWHECWRKTLSDSIRFVVENSQVVVASSNLNTTGLNRVYPEARPAQRSNNEASTEALTFTRDTEGWTYTKDLLFTAPPGKYYIGDLCYALYENIYDEVFGGQAYSSGYYRKGNTFFLVDGTAYGDGDYVGTDGKHYLVDAGIIGICSADLIDPNNSSWKRGGNIYNFTGPVTCRFRGGVFSFLSRDICFDINTASFGDDEE